MSTTSIISLMRITLVVTMLANLVLYTGCYKPLKSSVNTTATSLVQSDWPISVYPPHDAVLSDLPVGSRDEHSPDKSHAKWVESISDQLGSMSVTTWQVAYSSKEDILSNFALIESQLKLINYRRVKVDLTDQRLYVSPDSRTTLYLKLNSINHDAYEYTLSVAQADNPVAPDLYSRADPIV